MPLALLNGEVRVAFAGRTSTEEQQDPRNSLIRQLDRCRHALPPAWVIVAHFYDVESGRMSLDERGHKNDYERFDIPIPRDGGINDLLEEASHPNRRFDVVICESVSRTARRMYESLTVERALQKAGVELLAANEPIKIDGGRSQQILQRRINQSVAEWQVHNLLEDAWGGLCTHTRDGWNIGKPPYGYTSKAYPHPNPAKAAKGKKKHRLEPDGARGETVTQIAKWRHHKELGYDAIVDLLNADLLAHPPPQPPGAHRARGVWGKSAVCDILRNPKYTGYQVFNRRATKSGGGKHNPAEKWVWSTEPVHEPLIPKWMFDKITERRTAKQKSRHGNEPNPHPQTLRTYVLRGHILHSCGRRMDASHRRGKAYYRCYPRANNRARPDRYQGHPKMVYVREQALLEALSVFYNDRVFGPHRRELLAADLAQLDDSAAQQREQDRQRHQRTLADITRRQHNLMRQAQDSEPGDPFAAGLRDSYNQLEANRLATLAAIQQLDAEDKKQPAKPTTADAAILDALPQLAINLPQAPQQLQRQLYQATRLTIEIHDQTQEATMTIRLPADQARDVAHTAEALINTSTQPSRTTNRVDVVGTSPGAPSRDQPEGLGPACTATWPRHDLCHQMPP